jgi:hypothetical protein
MAQDPELGLFPVLAVVLGARRVEQVKQGLATGSAGPPGRDSCGCSA